MDLMQDWPSRGKEEIYDTDVKDRKIPDWISSDWICFGRQEEDRGWDSYPQRKFT